MDGHREVEAASLVGEGRERLDAVGHAVAGEVGLADHGAEGDGGGGHPTIRPLPAALRAAAT